jgi:two-component system, NtrC family, response regulator HydG
MPAGSVLIIEDDPDVVDALTVLLEDEFSQIHSEANPNRIHSISFNNYDIILLDMNFSAGINSGNEGLHWLSVILNKHVAASVIMMTAYGNINLAVEAIKRGAKDFVLKPWDNDKLLATIKANAKRKKQAPTTLQQNQFVEGKSRAMVQLQEQIKKVAATDASVLILGENGTGKELVAQKIHELSHRAAGPFITVDLSALTETLFESEIFGYKKGAFTDAKTDKKGRLEAANGGTLFLDEIGNLAVAQQSKLLTVLQTRKVTPVGGSAAIDLDIRVISATNAVLHERVKEGTFRQDLMYRINTITLTMPPLRERGDDVITLSGYFLQMYSSRYNKRSSFDGSALSALKMYAWPGNVRELQHTIEKAVILSPSDEITEADLNLSISGMSEQQSGKTLDEIEKTALQNALAEHGGNIVKAARALGITRQTLYNKMKKYGI